MSKILETTATAIKNQERLIGLAQQNIVNANDPNYIKQKANLVSNPQVGAEIISIDLEMNEGLLKDQYSKNSEYHSSLLTQKSLQKVTDSVYSLKLEGKNSVAGALNDVFGNVNELRLESNDFNNSPYAKVENEDE